MANIAIFRINYKSDFILTLNSDAGWMTPFCIKFWTGAPSRAYFVSFDGITYTHCAPVDGEPTKLLVQFDDHHLPIGDLKFQIGYHFTVADFPTSVEDEVLNQASVIIEVDDVPAQVMLDLNGETAPEIEFSLPAYANEAQRIANEEQRIAAEQQRIANEDARIQAEETRQYNEQQRIQHEEYRVSEFARLKSESEAATTAANAAATLANEKAQLAADKAALAQAAATLANEKAQLAADKAALAQAAATLANEKAALAQQKAAYAQTQGDYAKAQGDYAKAQGDTAQADHERAEADHTTAADDHSRAEGDHTTAASDHSRAESDHTTAASDHSRAESDHTTAASDHSRAESDHTTAASDHTRAESDHTTAADDHTTAQTDHAQAVSDHAAVEVYVDSLGAFDISSYHATGGELAKYADLTAALGTDGANIPEGIRKGGMSVKFVQSSDNKYVQYMLKAQSFTTNEADWELDVTDKNLIYNPQEYTSSQKETARTNIGLSNITPKASTGEESLKVTTNEDKTIVNIHKTTQAQNEIAITDDNDDKVVYIDNNGLHAKEIFYGLNETNLQDKIDDIEAQIGGGGSTRNVVLIMFMGQSNMAGRGITTLEHPQDAPAVIEGAGYEFRAISDPTKLYPITKTFGNTEDNPQGIDDGGRKTGSPVPSFVNAFYRVAKTTVIGVSASEGGETIVNFQPNTKRYNDAVSRFHAAETYLTNNNYNILARYVVWCQGEADGDTGMSEADYVSYFNTMATALFAEGIEKMMVIRIGEYNGSEEISYSNIINAQTNLCKNNDNYIMVTTVLASLKAKGLMKDDFHYYQEGYNIEGTLSGLHTANYYLFGKSDVMYDVMTNALYFDSKSY